MTRILALPFLLAALALGACGSDEPEAVSPAQAEAEQVIADTPLCEDWRAVIEAGATRCRKVPSCEEVETGVAEAVDGRCIDPAKIE